MVRTRSVTKKTTRTPAKKKSTKTEELGDEDKKTKGSIERCKNWIQQQKKEKLKYQPDEINSEDSEDETPEMRLETISVGKFNRLINLIYKITTILNTNKLKWKFFFLPFQRNRPMTKRPKQKSVLAVSGNVVIAFSIHMNCFESTLPLIWSASVRMKSNCTCAIGICAISKLMIHWYWEGITAFTSIWPNWKRTVNNCCRRNCCQRVWMIRGVGILYLIPVTSMCACGTVARIHLIWLRIILSMLGFIVCTRWKLINRAIGIKWSSVNGMWWKIRIKCR